jgi:hypothetical protein
MTEIQTIIYQALDRYQAIRLKRMWLAAFAALTLVIALTAILDRAWMFTGLARWSGWIVGVALAVWSARRAAGPVCVDATTLAHRIEAEAGETTSVVATAIDPAVRRAAGDESLAGLLVDRLDLRAAEVIRAAPPNFRGRLRVPGLLAITAVAAVLLLVVLQGGNGLLRVIFPWQVSPYTVLSLEGPPQAFAEGAAFALTARVSGVAVGNVTLYRMDSPESLATGVPNSEGTLSIAVSGISGPTDFVIRGGDGQSAPLRVTPYLLPRIDTFEIAVTPPAYAVKDRKTETSPSFSVLRGSHLRYRVHLKAPAVSLAVERSAAPIKEEKIGQDERKTLYRGAFGEMYGKEDPTKAQPAGPTFRADPANPLVWEAEWPIAGPEDVIYRFVIKGEHGDQIRNDEAWRINVLTDAPPVARIQGHNADEVLKLGNEKVSFKLSAVDDIQLSSARLIFRNPGQPYVRQEVKLPPNTDRTWSGAELLDLAPFKMQPLDIIAVHFEAEDSNTLDGPGIGRSEVIYLQVPLPESTAENDPAGGGGGEGAPPINPLELQMEILKSTIQLNPNSPLSDRAAIAHDQKQNTGYVMKMMTAATKSGLVEFANALRKARSAMYQATRTLDQESSQNAVPHMEAALGALIEASKLAEAAEDAPPPPPGEGPPQESFTLSPPKPKKSQPSEGDDEKNNKSEKEKSDAEKGKSDAEKKEKVRKLMEEVQRQLTEQQKLNKSEGEDPGKAGQQQALAQDAKAAAETAGQMEGSGNESGDPKAAAAELDKASALQKELADSLAKGEGAESSGKGTQSAEALANALSELSALIKSGAYEGDPNSPGYERLVGDYLRSISYE